MPGAVSGGVTRARERGAGGVSSLTYAKRAAGASSAAEAAAALAGAYFPRDENDIDDALVVHERPRTKNETFPTLLSRFAFTPEFVRDLAGLALGPGDRRARSRLEKATRFARLVAGRRGAACSALDWPMRRLFSETAEVPSSPGSYDERVGAALWEEAGKAAGLAGPGIRQSSSGDVP